MTLDTKTKKQVLKMLRFTEAVRKEIHNDITPQQMLTFLFVAANQGINQKEISNQLNMPEGTVSRNIYKLGTKLRRLPNGETKKMGLGLIESLQEDLEDIRKKNVYLTEEGERVINSLGPILDE